MNDLDKLTAQPQQVLPEPIAPFVASLTEGDVEEYVVIYRLSATDQWRVARDCAVNAFAAIGAMEIVKSDIIEELKR